MVTGLLACSCSVPNHKAPTSSPQATNFETTIASIERTDPGSPAVLNAQINNI